MPSIIIITYLVILRFGCVIEVSRSDIFRVEYLTDFNFLLFGIQ
jgi:hypothetical protein